MVSYLGPTFIPTRGLYTTVAWEHYQDVSVVKTARNAFDLELNFFPLAHLELEALGRIELNGDGPQSALGMLQIHYYL